MNTIYKLTISKAWTKKEENKKRKMVLAHRNLDQTSILKGFPMP